MGFKRLLQLSLACLTLNIASLANAQAAQTYLDPVSGITFQRLTTTYAGFSFGVALPEVPSDEFIGQLVSSYYVPVVNESFILVNVSVCVDRTCRQRMGRYQFWRWDGL